MIPAYKVRLLYNVYDRTNYEYSIKNSVCPTVYEVNFPHWVLLTGTNYDFVYICNSIYTRHCITSDITIVKVENIVDF